MKIVMNFRTIPKPMRSRNFHTTLSSKKKLPTVFQKHKRKFLIINLFQLRSQLRSDTPSGQL